MGEQNETPEVSPAASSSLNIKLTIMGDGFEISTEGPILELFREIDAISDFANRLTDQLELGALEEIPETVELEEIEVVPTTTADIPTIKPTSGIKDNVEALFKTTWGKSPRPVKEVWRALEVNAVYTGYTQVSTALRRLIREGILRRIQREGRWAYFAVPGRE